MQQSPADARSCTERLGFANRAPCVILAATGAHFSSPPIGARRALHVRIDPRPLPSNLRPGFLLGCAQKVAARSMRARLTGMTKPEVMQQINFIQAKCPGCGMWGNMDRTNCNSLCPICLGDLWVCENHPDVPWMTGRECCGGAGMPCVCNTVQPPAWPPGTVTVWDINSNTGAVH